MRRKLKITFKNGVTIKVNVSDWTATKRAGQLTGLEWTTPRFACRRLVDVDLDEVVAIVRTRW